MELKVIVPTSLDEITLSQYQRFAKIEGDEEFLTKKMLEIFCNVPIKELPNIRFKAVYGVFNAINNLMGQKPSLKTRFNLNGKEFGFIPSLEDITYGEFVDLDTYMNNADDLHKTMSVLYRPITKKLGKRYSIENYESAHKYCDIMKEAPMDIVMGAVVFFWTLGKDLLKGSQIYFQQMEEELNNNTAENKYSPPNGIGIQRSILLVRETLQDLIEYQSYPLPNALRSYPLKKKKEKSKINL